MGVAMLVTDKVVEPRYYTVEGAARYLSVSKSWLYACWARGEGPPRSKIAGRTFVSIAALDVWVASRQVIASG